MEIISLALRHFRNFAEEYVEFSPGLNLFLGDNAQGKTNLLEAISLIATGRSFRTLDLSECIMAGKEYFSLEAIYRKEGIKQQIKLYLDQGQKRLVHNATSYHNFTPLLGNLPCIVVLPEDIQLVMGGPSHRRKLLDFHLSQKDPLYLHFFLRYQKALKQRNAALKARAVELLPALEILLAQAGNYLREKRAVMLTELAVFLKKHLGELSSQRDEFSLEYAPSTPLELTEALEKSRKKDLILGVTSLGPHRDEVLFIVNGQSAADFCSEGQKRSLVTALKLAEFDLLGRDIGSTPLFCIDDFNIHLDAKRQALLSSKIGELQQAFLTSPHSLLAGSSKVIAVAEGRLTEISQQTQIIS